MFSYIGQRWLLHDLVGYNDAVGLSYGKMFIQALCSLSLTIPRDRVFINVTIFDSLIDFSKLSKPKSYHLKVSFGCKAESKCALLRTALNSVYSASGATDKNK